MEPIYKEEWSLLQRREFNKYFKELIQNRLISNETLLREFHMIRLFDLTCCSRVDVLKQFRLVLEINSIAIAKLTIPDELDENDIDEICLMIRNLKISTIIIKNKQKIHHIKLFQAIIDTKTVDRICFDTYLSPDDDYVDVICQLLRKTRIQSLYIGNVLEEFSNTQIDLIFQSFRYALFLIHFQVPLFSIWIRSDEKKVFDILCKIGPHRSLKSLFIHHGYEPSFVDEYQYVKRGLSSPLSHRSKLLVMLAGSVVSGSSSLTMDVLYMVKPFLAS
jgi:hypothetical protein